MDRDTDTVNDKEDIHWDRLEPYTGDDDDTDGGQGFVYVLLEEPDEGADMWRVKVGRSGDVDKRVRDLQTGNPRELRKVEKFPVQNMPGAEKAAHQVAGSKYEPIDTHREWFNVHKKKIDKFVADIEKAVEGY